jgi:hypothetical protein
MSMTDLMFGIGAEYKGRPAFKRAEKDIFGLQKGINTLAKSYIGLAGAQKAFRFAQMSVREFAADDLAIQKLSKTLGNLGLSYEQTNVENFIAGLENTYHVADDLLRPAFAQLVQTTQSYTKSKELLTTALNASAGAGVDLTTTVSDLSQAYVGNLKGLKKYNLGLTNAELATMSFEQIQNKLNETFSGQAALAADTYAFKIEAINIAAGNAKETIGKGLVDALVSATSKTGDVNDLADSMDRLARLSSLGLQSAIFLLALPGKGLQALAAAEDKLLGRVDKSRANKTPYNPMSGNLPSLSPQAVKDAQARAKRDKEAAKRQKELAAFMVKQTKAIKEQTALAKAKAILDEASMVMNMDLIQNTAALQGKVTADETLRLQLQQAILLGNSQSAAKLAQTLLDTQLAAVMVANVNPFGNWSKAAQAAIDAIKQLQSELAKLGTPTINVAANLAQSFGEVIAFDLEYEKIATQLELEIAANQAAIDLLLAGSMAGNTPAYAPQTGNFTYGQGNPLAVQVFVDPSAMAYGINAAVIDNSANGNSSTYSTIKSYAGGA